MSIHQLPPEICMDIVDHLNSDVDKACFRIVCGDFYRLIPAPFFLSFKRQPSAFRPLYIKYIVEDYKIDRLDYFSRLLRPGNLLYNPDGKLCGECHYVLPQSRFSIDIAFKGYRLCDDCIASLLSTKLQAVESLIYNGNSYRACFRCAGLMELKKIHFHYNFGPDRDGEHDARERLCNQCHGYSCSSLACPGWPDDFLQENKFDFCTGLKPYCFDSCSRCANCRFIESIPTASTTKRATISRRISVA